MQKTFILDSSVLLHTADSLLAFDNNIIIIPEAVIEEISSFRKDRGDLGENARKVGAFIDQYRWAGRLNDGVYLPNGSLLKVELNHYDCQLPQNWDLSRIDNRVLQVCLALQQENDQVYLITKDVFTRIKADMLGIQAQDYKYDQAPELPDQFQGRAEVWASSSHINEFFSSGILNPQDVKILRDDQPVTPDLHLNQFLVIRSIDHHGQSALGMVGHDGITPLKCLKQRPFGVNPRNTGQKFYQEALMRSALEFPLVICKGPAGTAKTFYSLAVGLEKVINAKEYRKLLICRPNIGMDEAIGYLPGTETEKLGPLMRGVNDNLELLVDSDDKARYHSEKELRGKVEELYARGIINIEAIAFLRGRSITGHWIIIDEAQNLTPNQAKGIITRAGADTKIIMIGDPTQIDHPYLDSRSNGLCYASENMKGSPICCQITLWESECERSVLAMEAAQRL